MLTLKVMSNTAKPTLIDDVLVDYRLLRVELATDAGNRDTVERFGAAILLKPGDARVTLQQGDTFTTEL